MVSSSEKNYNFFTGYNGDDETKWMYFFIEDGELLKTSSSIWSIIRNSIKKNLMAKTIFNQKSLKTKIKSYSNEATDFDDKEAANVGSNYTHLAVILLILLDTVLKPVIRKCF